MKIKPNQASDFSKEHKRVPEKLVLKFNDEDVVFFVDKAASVTDLGDTLLQAAIENPNLFEAIWTIATTVIYSMGEQDKATWMLNDGLQKAKVWSVIEAATENIDLIQEF